MSDGRSGQGMGRFYLVFAAVAVIGVGAVAYSILGGGGGGAASEPVDLNVGDLHQLTEMAVPVEMGEKDAPVTIIVFEDYLCSHCAMFSLRERPLLETNYVKTGKARLVYYDFPLNPQQGTFLAARAARCAGDQGRFWDYQDQLYRNQVTWGAQADKLEILEEYAGTLGLDTEAFRSCLRSDRHAEEVSANRELAHALGLNGTPSVLVGSGSGMSRRLPNYAYETIQAAVESLLEGASN